MNQQYIWIKIVVSNRYRRKGISDRLMNELFNRLRSENVKHLTTGFLRPEYFYRFDFKVSSVNIPAW